MVKKHPNSLANLKRPVKGGPSPNPKGRPPNLFNSQIKQLTAGELAEIANLIVKGNLPALKAIAKSENATVIQVMVASVAVKIITKGDMAALDTLMNRIVGKVKEHVEVTGKSAPQVLVTLPSNGYEVKKLEE